MSTLPTPQPTSMPFLGRLPVRPELRPKLPERRLPPLPPCLARVFLHIYEGGEERITDIAPEEALALVVAGEA